MSNHPKLYGLSNIKHQRAFSRYLRGIEKDFKSLDISDYEVEFSSKKSSKSFLQRFILNQGFKEALETMVVSTELAECPVEIYISKSRSNVNMPYSICIELPVPMTGQAEFRRGSIGSKWNYMPKNRNRLADLRRAIPKVKMTQQHGSLVYLIKIGHFLKPISVNKTIWQIESGYEGNALTGGYRPRVSKFLKAIPTVKALLIKWNTN